MKKKFMLLVIFLIAFFTLAGCGKMKLEEEVETFKIYSELPEDITNAFVKDFEKNHKGKLKIEIVKRIDQQGPGRISDLKDLDFDIWLGGTAEDYYLADNKKMLTPYEAKDLRNIPTGLKDKHGTWTGLFTTNLVFLSNKKALAEAATVEGGEAIANYYHENVFAAMLEIRTAADELETMISEKYLTYPTYGQLLFGVN